MLKPGATPQATSHLSAEALKGRHIYAALSGLNE
jgi:hypothetical protein